MLYIHTKNLFFRNMASKKSGGTMFRKRERTCKNGSKLCGDIISLARKPSSSAAEKFKSIILILLE